MITDERIAEIKARAEAATAGPWRVENDGDVMDVDFGPIVEWPWRILAPDETTLLEFTSDPRVSDEDAAFIAAARRDIPLLLAEIERLKAMLATAEDADPFEAFGLSWDEVMGTSQED